MSQFSREIEFEFQGGDDTGGGEFKACGTVVNELMDYLAHEKIQEAASLFASCAETVGAELIQLVIGEGVSKRTIASLAKMFAAARDFQRAAFCAEKADQPEVAAHAFEASYEFDKAAEHYLKAGDLSKAAELFERNLSFDRAAELYLKMKDYPRSAENLERAGDLYRAGQVYLKMSLWNKAVEVLQRVEPKDEQYIPSMLLLCRVLEKTGNRDAAMQRYVGIVRETPLSEENVEIHYRLAKLCVQRGMNPQATKLLRGVLSIMPDHEGVRKIAAHLGLQASSQQGTNRDAPISLELSAVVDEQKVPDQMVGVDPDFEFLRQVPLFSELSLKELKYAQTMCDRVCYPAGTHLIQKGNPGEALYVIARGTAEVTTSSHGQGQERLALLEPGAHVGEMSLLDDAKTSANVTALEEVIAFRLTASRFVELLQANERIQLRIYRVLINTLLQRLRDANAR